MGIFRDLQSNLELNLFWIKISLMLLTTSRHPSLKEFSHEHSAVLDLCSRIRFGFANGISAKRIKKYADWFKENSIDPHFEMEKKNVFPILGYTNVRIKRALANHRRLTRLFEETDNLHIILNKIEEELGTYIRFEERILYNEIQKVASPTQLLEIERSHQKLCCCDESWEDEFWI